MGSNVGDSRPAGSGGCCAPEACSSGDVAVTVPSPDTQRVEEADSGRVRNTDGRITLANRVDHFLARWGFRRGEHRVPPGLYALGRPTKASPVLVTANYTLSFDALRGSMASRDAYILVLDTQGVNVWCAAGKGTFGTDELVRRLETAQVREIVDHRRLILPQLGAPGVAAHEVKRRTGFTVAYGPVRATDLPKYLAAGECTAEMRRVNFSLKERAVLVPVELVHVALPTLVAAAVLYLTTGIWGAVGVVSVVTAGVVLFPLLLPWLPSAHFSSKGYVLGAFVALVVVLLAFLTSPHLAWYVRVARSAAFLVGLPAVTAFLALNFTGATPITSQTGVKREMFRYIPSMAWTSGLGVLLVVASALGRWIGG